MSTVDAPDRGVWLASSEAVLALGAGGQLSWQIDVADEHSDTERRSTPYGDVMVLRHVWSADRLVLRRLVVEVDWASGPLVLAEARRPRGGWHGDELARLLLSVLSFGTHLR